MSNNSNIAMNSSSILAPSEYLVSREKCSQYCCQSLYELVNFWSTGNLVPKWFGKEGGDAQTFGKFKVIGEWRVRDLEDGERVVRVYGRN